MGSTIQILTKTNCCVKLYENETFDEDIKDESDDENNDDHKLMQKIESFLTEPNLID